MSKNLTYAKVVFIIFILISMIFTGSIQKVEVFIDEKESIEIKLDHPSVLPNWNDGEYHDYFGTIELLSDFDEIYSDLVYVYSIGKSILGKDIWCIRITNEKNNSKKYSCLYDGCFHGNEWEGGEACLYFAEYLLTNFGKNDTITRILNKSEVYIVPLVNPDGRQDDRRHNHNNIDANRNFDVNFGEFKGGSLKLGKFFPLNWIWLPLFPYFFVKCGRYPFSEPESRAIRDLMKELEYRDFSFYLTLHTATHYFARPSDNIINSDYEMSSRDIEILDYTKSWVENNTEYRASKDHYQHGRGYSNNYCFKEFHIPSFALEALNEDYEPGYTPGGRHDHLVHWMNTTLPIFFYLLVNIENLYNWEIPYIDPQLPEGVPPPPL